MTDIRQYPMPDLLAEIARLRECVRAWRGNYITEEPGGKRYCLRCNASAEPGQELAHYPDCPAVTHPLEAPDV